MKDVARKVIGHVRFSLLDPEYLSLVEKENELKPFIPVSLVCIVTLACRSAVRRVLVVCP